MSINIGDKVRFLREVGGGVVTGFRKGGFILVEDKDGFEIPMLESDLVVIPENNKVSPASDISQKKPTDSSYSPAQQQQRGLHGLCVALEQDAQCPGTCNEALPG